jgi:hypothetical protein
MCLLGTEEGNTAVEETIYSFESTKEKQLTWTHKTYKHLL